MMGPEMIANDRGDGDVVARLLRAIRLRHYSARTEQAYVHWVKRYLAFHGGRDPLLLTGEAVDDFLTHLAVAEGVAAATQNQAMCALVFFYRHVLEVDAVWLKYLVRAKRPSRVPTVLSREEIRSILQELDGAMKLAVSMLYGSGLRKMELLNLRVRDVDLDQLRIHVKSGKGGRDRIALLGEILREDVCRQIRHVAELNALPSESDIGGAYLFPSQKPVMDQRTGAWRFRHLCPSVLSRAVRRAARQAGIVKTVCCHAFRHSFATHLLEMGCDIRTLQELMGHRSVRTTMIYTHVLHQPDQRVRSPLDLIDGGAS